VYFVSITVGRTYAGKIAVLPEQGATDEQEVLEIEHSGDGVGKEAQEMWEGDVGDAVGWRVLPTALYMTTGLEARRGPTCPHAMMVHFHDTPGAHLISA
jgi:hypothetical protein